MWSDVGRRFGGQAICGVLASAGLVASNIDLIVTTSVSGLAVPSQDVRIGNVL
ncbi:hypothetical protein [Actinoplanes sp. NPDC089786]|uniref:hypothetical protein n=1 Tax=Actinoplanes sp. NPDC089786 TaxID=3155185 RepID=UPI00341D1C9F